jgi:hypothetical protein
MRCDRSRSADHAGHQATAPPDRAGLASSGHRQRGMWSAKIRVGRYRIRPEAGRFVLSHNLSGRVWNALRDDAFATVEEAKGCAQAHLQGMLGNLQGISGKAMPEIPSLDIPLLEASTDPEAKYRYWRTSRRDPLSLRDPYGALRSDFSGAGRNVHHLVLRPLSKSRRMVKKRDGKSSRFRRHASTANTSASVIIPWIRRSLSQIHRCLA